ncbi:MAG: hypothetical protein ACREIV_08615, partial [Planctomycetaceae bacterium]
MPPTAAPPLSNCLQNIHLAVILAKPVAFVGEWQQRHKTGLPQSATSSGVSKDGGILEATTNAAGDAHMRMRRAAQAAIGIGLLIAAWLPAAGDAEDEAAALVAAMLGQTPILDDLRGLTDMIGGRPTGSPANRAAVDWAMTVFRNAGVPVTAEAFEMPMQWQELRTTAAVTGDADFRPRVVAMPFSTGTPAAGLTAPLLQGGSGSPADLERLGDRARGAWILFETPVLDDAAGLAGLFAEYTHAAAVEPPAFAAGAAGIVFMSSRPANLLYRHNASLNIRNRHPALIME